MTNGRTSKFMLPKYLIEYQDLKIIKSNTESEKSNQKKHKSNAVLKQTKIKEIKTDMMSFTST